MVNEEDEMLGFRNVEGDGLKYRIEGQAPLQVHDGILDDCTFDFRSRHRRWWMGIHRDNVTVAEFGARYGEGDFDASWMPYDVAEQIIKECARRFRAGETDNGDELFYAAMADIQSTLFKTYAFPWVRS